MAECPLCDREMNVESGCINHNVMLLNGDIIESPKHVASRSLDTNGNRCPDCNAAFGDFHHPHCDWARTPDGGQLLTEALEYWNPETAEDPRKRESPYLFVVFKEGQDPTHQPYSSMTTATKVATTWEKENPSDEVRIRALPIQNGVSEYIFSLLENQGTDPDSVPVPDIDDSYDLYLIKKETENTQDESFVGIYESSEIASISAAIWNAIERTTSVTVSGHPLHHESNDSKDNSEQLTVLTDEN